MSESQGDHIVGLSLECTLGETILINDGELVLQITDFNGRKRVRIVFMGDREKYKIGRLETSGLLLSDIIKRHSGRHE